MKPNHLQQEQIFYISFTFLFSHSNRLLLEFLHDFTSQLLHTNKHVRTHTFLIAACRHLQCFHPPRLHISPHTLFFSPTSWSQSWVGWLLCHRIKRVTHSQEAYLSLGGPRVHVLAGAEGSLPGRAHISFSTFVIRSIKAAHSRGRVPARGARSVRRVRCVNVSEIRAARSSAARSSQGLLSASREAFISVLDPLRNRSHAETDDLISPILYANAHQHRHSTREVLINACLPCTRETS